MSNQQLPGFDAEGITADVHQASLRIAWNQITAVYGYKRDCFVFDQIRIVIASESGNVEFSEDHPDFNALCAFLSAKLEVSSEWYQSLVTSSAFDTSWIVIYSNGDSTNA